MKPNVLKYSLFAIAVITVIGFFAFTYVPPKENTTSVVAADEKGIQFIEQDWSKALQQAKAEKKLVFLDIYATWCGPCKMLKKNTFSNEEVGAFFNSNFINVSVDGEKTIGPELARKFSLEAYPTLIIADGEGNPVLFTMGYLDPETLMKFAKEALKRKS